ncbi:Multidrug resistance-associated ABC transporter [Mycena kentingensis (nom. inval.)]|nr:Multidrug resistance-associated ABC transporter [Mycena kentingensis (nom. inval.)]
MTVLHFVPFALPVALAVALFATSDRKLSTRPGYYHLVRLAGCAILCALSSLQLARSGQDAQRIALFLFHCYVFVLAGYVYYTPRNVLALHLTVLLALFCVFYVATDIWTLATPNDIAPGSREELRLCLEIVFLSLLGIVFPLVTPRSVDEDVGTVEERASLLSAFTYSFLDPLIWTARRTGAVDIPLLPERNRAASLTANGIPILESNPGNLLRGIVTVFRTPMAALVFWYFLKSALTLAVPVGLKQLLSSLGPNPPIKPWFWILWILCVSVARTVANERYMYIALRTRVKLESILQHLIIKHSLRIRANFESSGKKKGSVGKLMNFTSDLMNIGLVMNTWLALVAAPMQLAISTWFLYAILDWSALVGLGVMVLCMPLPTYLTMWVMHSVQVERMKTTDERLQTVSETLSILRMVKMFGWESRMMGRMSEKRSAEVKMIRKEKLLSLFSGNVNFVIPFITMIATYATYTLVMKRALTASIVFSSLAVFDILRIELRRVAHAIPIIVKGRVSLGRLEGFLTETEILDSCESAPPLRAGIVAGFKNATFCWDEEVTLKIEDEIVFKPGVVNVITGPTGAGKSSMLLALLGEMKFTPLGDPKDAWFGLDRGTSGAAYQPQESWIQNDTIRANILMGCDAPFDEARYVKVVEQCGLITDLSLFEHGDLTLVGERGVSLSGGQKARNAYRLDVEANSIQARITLARCVYSPAKILLLDDPLAALDVKTANAIVDKCLAGDLLKGRTVLLVTHNVALASRVARVVVTISSQGVVTREEVEEQLVDVSDGPKPGVEGEEEKAPPLSLAQYSPTSHSVQKEDVAEGHVGWSAFRLYYSNLSRHPSLFWLLFIGGIVLNEATIVVQAWWLGLWSRQFEIGDPHKVSSSYYLSGYAILLAIGVVFFSSYFAVFTFGAIRSSLRIHQQLMAAVVGCTLRWLDATPTSRIMARAVQDIKIVDDLIGLGAYRVIQLSFGLGVKFTAIMAFSPAFLVSGIIITLLGGACGQLFMKAQLPVKREMSRAKAPILGHFTAVLDGLAPIRAFGLQDAYLKESLVRIDALSTATITFRNLNRWITVRSDMLGGLFTCLLATYLVYIRERDAATTGFVLNNAFGYSSMVLLWVQQFNRLELDGNRRASLERILEFVNIEQQKNPDDVVIAPPAYWPASGSIVAENLTAKYATDGADVLRNISFEIKPGERVAVVGRTGSGKSSLILSLLRCILTKGTVRYDGIDTSTLDLDVLRSNITIVPQVPDLLSGTLRYNLDPFGEYDDVLLNAALRSSGLSALQTKSETPLTLDTEISSGGGNISFGERQIIALARAVVRESKLLILDEATSGIDFATDAIIQNTLRNELKGVSVLTIAHRLKTIMDFDKIMVLDAGEIVEFDAPKTLLEKEDGYLKGLVEQSMDKDVLLAMV